MLNRSDIASSIKHFTKDGDHSSSFLRDVGEFWELEVGASQNISVVSCYVHSRVSLLFAMCFTFQQKSLKIGLYGKFLNSPALQQSNKRALCAWGRPNVPRHGLWRSRLLPWRRASWSGRIWERKPRAVSALPASRRRKFQYFSANKRQ